MSSGHWGFHHHLATFGTGGHEFRTRVVQINFLDQSTRALDKLVQLNNLILYKISLVPGHKYLCLPTTKKPGPPLKVHVCFGWSVFSSHVCTERNIKMDGSQILFKFCVLSQKYGYIFTNKYVCLILYKAQKCQNGPTYDTKYCSNAIHIRLIY